MEPSEQVYVGKTITNVKFPQQISKPLFWENEVIA